MSLQYLSLSQLALIVNDLLNDPKRAAALQAFDPTGRVGRRLDKRKIELDLLPDALKKIPQAERASEQDLDHDERARCLFRFSEALRRWPERTPAMVQAASFVLTEVVPSLEVTRATYGEQVAHVEAVRKHVASAKELLTAIPTPDGKDLDQWVTSFVASGDALGQILKDRGDELADAKDRRAATVLRPRIIGDLAKLRDDVRQAVEEDEALPRDLEARIFAYADELSRLDQQRRGGASPSQPAPAEPSEPVEPRG